MRTEARKELGLTDKLRKLQEEEFDEEIGVYHRSVIGHIFYSILWTIIVSGMIIGFVFFALSQIQISSIRIRGDKTVSMDVIKSQINLELPERYFNIDTKIIQTRLEAHPFIYKAQVHKTITGKLDVFLERSRPIATLMAEARGKNIPVYVDKYGRCVQVGVGLGMVDVPVISGIKFVNPVVGFKLPEWASELLTNLGTIKSQNNKLYQQISEINIMDEGQSYRILKINFIGLGASFVTDIYVTPQLMMQIWQLARSFEEAQDDIIPNFEYFDIRQGVIIGKRKVQNEGTKIN